MAQPQVKFVYTTLAKYEASDKNAGTLYFLSDVKQIFKGEECFGGGIYKAVTADPNPVDRNTLYINTQDGSIKYSADGTTLTTVVAPYVEAITGNGSATDRVSSKAVVDYVAEQIKAVNASGLLEKINKNATDIATITGTGEGSIKKAVDDAKTALTTEIDKKANSADTLAGYGIGDAYTKTETEEKIADAKAGVVNDLTAGNGITITGTKANKTISALVDPAEGNALSVSEAGLKVTVPAAAEYSISKDESSADYAAVYHLTKGGANTGVAINIPKDMVVKSGSVVKDPDKEHTGTFIELVLANATNDKIYIPVNQLIEYVTSGSAKGDAIFITVSDDHKVTATITDGSITKAKLATDVQTSLGKADTALQEASIVAGEANGTIKVGTKEVAVTGLGSAAYTASDAYIPAEKLGAIGDKTIKGYVDDAISGQDFDNYVQKTDITAGKANGTIAVKDADVEVTGLKSAAFTDATDYATKAQGAKADTAVQSVIEGTANGTISVDGTDVNVHGLGSAAFAQTSAFDASGSATTAESNAKKYTDDALTWQEL